MTPAHELTALHNVDLATLIAWSADGSQHACDEILRRIIQPRAAADERSAQGSGDWPNIQPPEQENT